MLPCMFSCFMDVHQLLGSESVRKMIYFTVVSVLTGSAYKAQETLLSVFVRSVELFLEIDH